MDTATATNACTAIARRQNHQSSQVAQQATLAVAFPGPVCGISLLLLLWQPRLHRWHHHLPLALLACALSMAMASRHWHTQHAAPALSRRLGPAAAMPVPAPLTLTRHRVPILIQIRLCFERRHSTAASPHSRRRLVPEALLLLVARSLKAVDHVTHGAAASPRTDR